MSAEKSLAVMPAHLLCVCVCVFRGRMVAHIPGPFAGVCSGEMPSSLLPDGKAVFLLWVTKSGLAGASLHLGLQKSAA